MSKTIVSALISTARSIPIGLFVLDGSDQVVWTNHHGRSLMAAADPIRMVGPRLSLGAGALESLRNALCAARSGLVRKCVRRPSALSAYQVTLHSADDPNEAPGLAVLHVLDPDVDPDDLSWRLRASYGLTDAESEVAVRIAAGDDLRQVARDRGVSVATVRTLLQRNFDKLGVRRQADLVRIVTLARFAPGRSAVEWKG